jgi:hypothetical protein
MAHSKTTENRVRPAVLALLLELKYNRTIEKIELVRKSDNVNQRFTQRIASEVIYA